MNNVRNKEITLYVKLEEKSDVKRPWCEKHMVLVPDVQIIQYTGLITGLVESIYSVTVHFHQHITVSQFADFVT